MQPEIKQLKLDKRGVTFNLASEAGANRSVDLRIARNNLVLVSFFLTLLFLFFLSF